MKSNLFLVVMAAACVPCALLAAEPRRTISLDGTWEIAEASADRPPAQFDRRGPVPGLVDMATPPFVDVGRKSDRREAFWYRRTFRIDEPLPAIARLKIHKAAYGTRVFLNGALVGDHAGCFTPGLLDVREHLRGNGATNELLVRVGATREALPASVPSGHDFEKTRYVPGIYDSAELILSGSPYVVRVQTAPDVPGQAVRVVVTVRSAAQEEAKLTCVVREAKSGRLVCEQAAEPVRLEPGRDTTADLRIPISDCRLWSPDDPFLYELSVSTGADVFRTRFGMRSFRLDKASGRAILNGRPFFLRGTNICIFRFFEDPGRGDKPWREDWARQLHRAFREMHWNSIRYCIGFPPEVWYRIADEEGFLIQDEFPIWHGSRWPAELKADEIQNEYAEWIHERCNHPCVVIWDAQNESVTTETGKAIQAVRALDLSNRPWDNGWSAPQSLDDVFECHPYVFNDANARLSRLAKLPATHLGNPAPNKNGNAMLINEYGWLWLNRDGTPTTLTKKVYENLLGADASPAQCRLLYARYLAALTEYWRGQRRFAGVLHFCGLTYSRPGGQTCDNFADIEMLAFEPEFRRYVRDAFAPVGVMIDEWAEELPAGQPHEFPVIVTSDRPEACKVEVQFRIARGDKTVFEASQAPEVSALGQARLAFRAAIPAEPGKYQLTAALRVAGVEPVRSLRDIEALSPEQIEARRSLAEGKPVLASSSVTVNGESFLASYAVDGDPGTRWSSEFADPQWIAVDLGETATISRVELLWEAAFGKAYAIQVSGDGQTWTDVFTTNAGKGAKEVVRFAPTPARRVRLLGTQRGTAFGYSLWEFKVFR